MRSAGFRYEKDFVQAGVRHVQSRLRAADWNAADWKGSVA